MIIGDYKMGDGRYYSFFQFFDVLFIMILAIFSLFSIVRIYYRRYDYAQNLHILFPLSAIMLFTLLRVVEYVYPDLAVCYNLRNFSLFLLLIILVTVNISNFKLSKKTLILGSLALILFLLGLNIYITEYSFHNILYSFSYKLIYMLVLLVSIFNSVKHFDFENEKMMFLPIVLLYLAPSLFYLMSIIFDRTYIDYVEIVLMGLFILYINIRFMKHDESSYSVLAFDKIGNMGLNYILVLDEYNRVIYTNQAIKNATFFKKTLKVNMTDFADLFKGDTIKKYNYKDKEYIEVSLDKGEIYFEFKVTELNENSQVIGHIITFTDITELLNLLINLEDKKLQSEKVNEKLKNYSEVVYHLEKEKEVNKLLEEIVTSRDKQLTYLSQMVLDANLKIEDPLFEKYIDVAINKSNDILEEVRETVSKYREYYGG